MPGRMRRLGLWLSSWTPISTTLASSGSRRAAISSSQRAGQAEFACCALPKGVKSPRSGFMRRISISHLGSPSGHREQTRVTSMSRTPTAWSGFPIAWEIFSPPGQPRRLSRGCRRAGIGRATSSSPKMAAAFVSIGSRSNVGERPIYAPWRSDSGRALVLAFTPEGKNQRFFATGLRNCVGMAVQPRTGELWCSVNERDGLGDDLVPDFVTRVREGAFYGWPWFYIGGNQDPRHVGEEAALRNRVSVPDVLLQPHSASMEMAFYDRDQFPAEYRGDIFAAFHGSWNRSRRTGYKVVRVLLKKSQPTGEYEDFLTGFVINDRNVWARPVGVAVAPDGSLLISEDGNGSIWRVSYRGKRG